MPQSACCAVVAMDNGRLVPFFTKVKRCGMAAGSRLPELAEAIVARAIEGSALCVCAVKDDWPMDESADSRRAGIKIGFSCCRNVRTDSVDARSSNIAKGV